MGRYSYVAILAFVMAGCLWLEVALRTRVFRRWLRLGLSILPAVVVFVLWDLYAIAEGHWWFAPDMILGVHLPGDLPVDEVLFFVAIPIASILTIEAVRAVKTRWVVGDEPLADEPERQP
jgi:lycopene cyclase domain-containing protein